MKNSPDAMQQELNGGRGGGDDEKKYTSEDFERMDVKELPIEGWSVVGASGRIVEIGTLGEGAGGAVTKCILKGGKTVFALKVWDTSYKCISSANTWVLDHHVRSNPRSQKANLPRIEL